MSKFKVFIRSYEDTSFIGREVKFEDIGRIADRENFDMSFTEVIEFLKTKGEGDFIFYDSYGELLQDESNLDNTYVIGEIPVENYG